LLAAFLPAKPAHAEKVLLKDGPWEVYTDGRVGGFVSWTYGDAFPQDSYGKAPDGSFQLLHSVKGGGWKAPSENTLLDDPNKPPGATDQGTINMMRVRSGFVSNVLGIGVRDQVSPELKITGYFQIWAFIESESRQKNRPNLADVRQGYGKVEGASWGAVTVGRMRCLFSRGATDIDVMYAHRWGVGFFGTNQIDSNGPTTGQIGFGVMGSGFAAGAMYSTPRLAGLQLDAAVFEPISLPAGGAWNRTKYLRPEGELTFERTFGATGKVALFANGMIQSVYKVGACTPGSTANPGPCDQTASGFGYGGRFEYGPVHVGVAGHRGKGLGLTYALESTEASSDDRGSLRLTDGYYAQTQFVIGPVEPFAGVGIARVFLTAHDKDKKVDPTDPMMQHMIYPNSIIKYQLGINGGVVYHLTPNLHFDLDYFRAQATWYLGEQQVLHAVNGGMTVSW
jgi:hypothetical protein